MKIGVFASGTASQVPWPLQGWNLQGCTTIRLHVQRGTALPLPKTQGLGMDQKKNRGFHWDKNVIYIYIVVYDEKIWLYY